MVVAVRRDPPSSSRQEAELFGEPGSRLFGCRTVPDGRGVAPPTAGVVVCPSLYAELAKNYRREVLVALSLAAQGVAVQRFQYRGTGHSEGDPAEVTFERMAADARAAAAHLVEATGVRAVGFLGSRFGGLVAATAAAGRPRAPLALWEPVVDPAQYFAGVFRARAMSQLAGQAPVAESLTDQLRTDGLVDIVGYPVRRSFIDSTVGRHLGAEAGVGPRTALLVQFRRLTDLRTEYDEVVTRWRRQGWSVTTAGIAHDEAWWFTPDPSRADDAVVNSTPLLPTTTDWLVGELMGEVA